MVIPDHSHYQGLNDRFALATPAVAYDYGQRLTFTLNNCAERPIHAEKYAKWWAETRGFKVVKMPKFDFFRIRGNGVVAAGDAVAVRGCNMTELQAFPVPEAYVDQVRVHRRKAFREGEGWSALPGEATRLAQRQAHGAAVH